MGFPGLIVVHIAMVTVVAVDRFIVDIDCFCPFLACTIYVTFCDAVVKPDSWQYRCDRLSTTILESISAGKLADSKLVAD